MVIQTLRICTLRSMFYGVTKAFSAHLIVMFSCCPTALVCTVWTPAAEFLDLTLSAVAAFIAAALREAVLA